MVKKKAREEEKRKLEAEIIAFEREKLNFEKKKLEFEKQKFAASQASSPSSRKKINPLEEYEKINLLEDSNSEEDS